jgi:phage internal scaffolding protein
MHTGKGLTEQHHKDECDVNKILSNYIKNGVLNHQRDYKGYYDDVTSIGDYDSAMQSIAKANSLFAELPSQIRNKFDNDPARFLEFAGNEENMQEMVELGMVNAPKKDPVDPSSTKEEIQAEEPVSDKAQAASETVAT